MNLSKKTISILTAGLNTTVLLPAAIATTLSYNADDSTTIIQGNGDRQNNQLVTYLDDGNTERPYYHFPDPVIPTGYHITDISFRFPSFDQGSLAGTQFGLNFLEFPWTGQDTDLTLPANRPTQTADTTLAFDPTNSTITLSVNLNQYLTYKSMITGEQITTPQLNMGNEFRFNTQNVGAGFEQPVFLVGIAPNVPEQSPFLLLLEGSAVAAGFRRFRKSSNATSQDNQSSIQLLDLDIDTSKGRWEIRVAKSASASREAPSTSDTTPQSDSLLGLQRFQRSKSPTINRPRDFQTQTTADAGEYLKR